MSIEIAATRPGTGRWRRSPPVADHPCWRGQHRVIDSRVSGSRLREALLQIAPYASFGSANEALQALSEIAAQG
jgi:hypothetical protein